MSARDELATVIESQPALLTMGNDQQDRARSVEIADAILAAGYTKPRTITTAEELDALPEGVIVWAKYGGVWTRVMDGPGAVWRCTGYSHHYRADEIMLPATLVHEPAP